MSETLGERFAKALAARDVAELKALLVDTVDFRALTPSDVWEASDAATVVDDILFDNWFDDGDVITELLSFETATIGNRFRVGYRLAVSNSEGEHVVDQQAYFDCRGSQISLLRVLCSGFNPVDEL